MVLTQKAVFIRTVPGFVETQFWLSHCHATLRKVA